MRGAVREMKRLIVHGIVMAALIIGLAACSSDTGSKPGADTVAEEVQTCEVQPTNFEWSGHTYRPTQENTDMEPMMKFGWLDCKAGRLLPADGLRGVRDVVQYGRPDGWQDHLDWRGRKNIV
ncbi:hypothetical protein [Paenibacillus kobensis]|uniref:hypothetical protein n=1 Tax=Paenibacillus kobensis TaxID=59841 RepID=UPI000FD8A485|nr:hypothetical protein [Paenibacillus kobensis]